MFIYDEGYDMGYTARFDDEPREGTTELHVFLEDLPPSQAEVAADGYRDGWDDADNEFSDDDEEDFLAA